MKYNDERIYSIIASNCGVTVEDLKTKSRKEPTMTARHFLRYIQFEMIRNDNELLTDEIICNMINCDRATMIHTRHVVKELIFTGYKTVLNKIITQIEGDQE